MSKPISTLKPPSTHYMPLLVDGDFFQGISTFISGYSHEIKNKLAMILSGSEIIALKATNLEKVKKYSKTIQTNTLKEIDLINAFVPYIKRTNAQIPLSHIISDFITLTHTHLKKSNIQGSFSEIDAITTPFPQQIMYHLLLNCIRIVITSCSEFTWNYKDHPKSLELILSTNQPFTPPDCTMSLIMNYLLKQLHPNNTISYKESQISLHLNSVT